MGFIIALVQLYLVFTTACAFHYGIYIQVSLITLILNRGLRKDVCFGKELFEYLE